VLYKLLLKQNHIIFHNSFDDSEYVIIDKNINKNIEDDWTEINIYYDLK